MINPALEKFDIRNFAERLTSKQGKNRYQCPVCEDGTLSIDPKTGAYHCWGDGCPSELIREAVNPLSEALAKIGIEKKDFVPKKHIPKQKSVIASAPIPDGVIELGTLPAPVQEEARVLVGSNIEIRYPYSDSQWVKRTEYPNGKKITLPCHVNSNGETVIKKGDREWTSYRFDEIVEHGAGQWILGVEGEKCTDIARSIFGFLSTTFQGGSWGPDALDKYFQSFKDAGISGLIYYSDHDKSGYAKAEKCKLAAAKAGLPFIALDPIRLWADCPDGGDIADWVKAGLASSEALHQEINLAADELRGSTQKQEPLEPAEPTQKQEPINDWAWEQWVISRKFTPDIIMEDEYFKFPKLPNSNAMISVLASMGKGKTLEIIEEMKRAGNGVHLIGYRNNLLTQTIKRAEKNGLNIYHLNDDNGTDLLLDDFAYLAYCLDSILKVEGYFKGRDIYIDESCSVLIHALNGGTLGDNQATAIRIFSTALKEANRVFLLDGNNSDLYTNFYHSLCPEKKLIKIQNTYNSPKHSIKIVDAVSDGEIKSRNRTPLIEMMLDKEVIPWIYCDSKERTKVLNRMFLDNSNKHGYCLNSETAGDDWAKEFLADPDKFILDKKPDYIILSPTAESGISAGDASKKAEQKRNNGEVTLNGYFTDKFTFFAGVNGTNSQLQAMVRLRDESISHYVFCPEQSTVKDRNSPQTYSVKQYQNILNDRILQSSILASKSANNPTRALEIIGNAIARTNDIWWEMSARLGVSDNYEMNNLRKCLIYGLESAGHNVEVVQKEANDDLKKAESAAKVTVQKIQAKEVLTAVEFETVEEAKQAAKANPRKDTQRRIEKTFFLDRLPGIKDSPLWGEDFIYECHVKRKEFVRNIERYWFVKNFDVSQKRHEARWFYEATKEDFHSARVTNMTHSVIWALRELDIMKFTDGREYHKNSKDVLNLIQKLRENKDIRTALKMENMPPTTETGKENINIISSLLGMIGYKNKSVGKKFVDDIRLNHYQAVPIGYTEKLEDGEFDLIAAREDILTAVGKRFTAWMESEKSIIDWDPVTDSVTDSVIDSVIDSVTDSVVMEYANVIRLAFEIADTPANEYELIQELTADKPESVKRLIFHELSDHDKARVRRAKYEYEKTFTESIAA